MAAGRQPAVWDNYLQTVTAWVGGWVQMLLETPMHSSIQSPFVFSVRCAGGPLSDVCCVGGWVQARSPGSTATSCTHEGVEEDPSRAQSPPPPLFALRLPLLWVQATRIYDIYLHKWVQKIPRYSPPQPAESSSKKEE